MSHSCRLCLSDTNESRVQILFGEESDTSQQYVDKILNVTGIELTPIPGVLTVLCTNCVKNIQLSYNFRVMCRENNQTFIDIYGTEPLKEDFDLEFRNETETTEYLEEFNSSADHELIGSPEIVFSVCEDDENLSIYEKEEKYMPNFKENFINCDEFVNIEDIIQDNDQSFDANDSEYNPYDDIQRKPRTKTRKRGRPRAITTTNKRAGSIATKSASIICDQCGNKYYSKSALKMHLKRHMRVKPYSCEICNKKFAGPSELTRHMRIHSGVKPYSCRYCERTFSDRSSSIRHERTHTNERPFKCESCDKRFSYSNVLKNHLLTHTGEKPFSCDACSKTFSRKHQLLQHYATLTHQDAVMKMKQNVNYDSLQSL